MVLLREGLTAVAVEELQERTIHINAKLKVYCLSEADTCPIRGKVLGRNNVGITAIASPYAGSRGKEHLQ